MRPEDLAAELGVDAKRLRGWLRSRWPRRPDEHGKPLHLTDEQVSQVRFAFGSRTASSSARRPAARLAPTQTPVPPAVPGWSAPPSWAELQCHADAVLAAGMTTQNGWSTAGTRAIKLVAVVTGRRPKVDLDAFVVVK